jgi:hypothetical protein
LPKFTLGDQDLASTEGAFAAVRCELPTAIFAAMRQKRAGAAQHQDPLLA